MVARARPLLVALFMLLVDDDDPEIPERAEERRARAHDHARHAAAHHLPLVEPLAGRETAVKDRHGRAEARTKTPHGLRRERDLGHEHAGGLPALEHALDSGKIDLGLAGAGHAVHEHHVARAGTRGRLDRRKRRRLDIGEMLGRRRAGRRERALIGHAAPSSALPHLDHAFALERADGGRHIREEQVELARRHRTAAQRIDQLALPMRVLGRLKARRLRSERDDPLVRFGHGGALDAPHAVSPLDHARGTAGSEEQADAVGKRSHIFMAHPTRHGHGLARERRFDQNRGQRLDLFGIEPTGSRQIECGFGQLENISRRHAPRKVHEHGGPHLDAVGELCRHGIAVRVGECARGNIEHERCVAAHVRGDAHSPVLLGKKGGLLRFCHLQHPSLVSLRMNSPGFCPNGSGPRARKRHGARPRDRSPPT